MSIECPKCMENVPDDDNRNTRIEQKLDLVIEKMSSVEEMTAKVIAEVKPTLDELMNSSLIKMLGIKKGK